jgi:hypothetical protein
MITFLVGADHRITHQRLVTEKDGPAVSVLYYHQLFSKREVPRGTYVFTDFDRLNFWDLEVAGEAFAVIRSAGCLALNDPARARQRYALLRRLRREGINAFGVYRIEAGEMPERYPVFLRNEAAHGGPLSQLLHNAGALQSAIDEALAGGVPERHLLAVEYAAEPLANGIFRKMSAYRVADRIVPTTSVHDRSWIAKQGERGIAGEALYREESELLRSNPYAEVLMRAFKLGNIEYGRADFGIVGGKVQIYEINTNPMLPAPDIPHPFQIRRENRKHSWAEYVSALRTIDTDGGHAIPLHTPKVSHRRWQLRWRLSRDSALGTP